MNQQYVPRFCVRVFCLVALTICVENLAVADDAFEKSKEVQAKDGVAGKHVTWQKFDPVKLKQLNDSGKTVMLSFTAKWCVTCKVNEKVAIDTQETADTIKKLDAVAMLGDWTNKSAAIEEHLKSLKRDAIPLVVVYSGQDPKKRILLEDSISQKRITETLEKAGQSRKTERVLAR